MSFPRSIFAPLALAAAVLSAAPWAARAQALEVEADPVAYALNGFSLHLARVAGALRVNVGAFGIDVPGGVHGNEGWSSTMRGTGVKVDYLGASPGGFFVGLDGGYMRMGYELLAEGRRANRDVVGVGLRGGYRKFLGSRGLYVAPWVGVSYNFLGDDVVIGGERFERDPVTVFPTVHIGWRF